MVTSWFLHSRVGHGPAAQRSWSRGWMGAQQPLCRVLPSLHTSKMLGTEISYPGMGKLFPNGVQGPLGFPGTENSVLGEARALT